MGAAPIVSGVLGVVGSASKASAQRKQVKAANAQQKRQIENEQAQLEIQRQQIQEKAVIDEMDRKKQQAFAEYQVQMSQMQRASDFQQQVAATTAQGILDTMQTNAALFSNEQQGLMSKMQTQSAKTENKAGLLGALIEGSQAGTNIEQQRYGALGQVNEAMANGDEAKANALLGQMKADEQLQTAAVQTYNQLEQAATESGKKLTNGEKKRLMQQAMYAAQGVSVDSETSQALLNADTTTTNLESVNEQYAMQQADDSTLMQMLSQGKLAEVAATIGIEQANALQRKAIAQGILTNTQADAQQRDLQSKLDYMSQASLAKSGDIGTQEMLDIIIGEQNERDIQGNAAQTTAGRNVAMQQLNASQSLANRTDNINRLAADAGFNLQGAAAQSTSNSQLSALKAQSKGLKYIPQKAPSVMGAVAGGLLNAGVGLYANQQQEKLNQRNFDIQTGNVDMGRVYMNEIPYKTEPVGLSKYPEFVPATSFGVNDSVRFPSLLGG